MGAKVTGRLWPLGVPFDSVTSATTGEPMVRDGFVCRRQNGDFQFLDADEKPTHDLEEAAWMSFYCPVKNRYCGQIRVDAWEKPRDAPSWVVTGPIEAPTLYPSVNHEGCWHGWLKAGVWEEC